MTVNLTAIIICAIICLSIVIICLFGGGRKK